MRRIFALVPLLLVFCLGGPVAAQEISFSESELEIETSGGQRHHFDVELAITAQQRSLGLMFRNDLAADAGMLFIYPRPQIITMWMQNTPLPLDMIFIGQDNRIEKIVERTIPYSTNTISSGRTVKAVLEVNGGTASRLGLRVGDQVISRDLGS